MTDIVIAAAARTPVGSFNGAFASLTAHDLGAIAIGEVLRRAKVEAAEVDEVVMGQILTAGAGQNPARQAAVKAGIPVEKTAYGINQLCGSGLRAIALGFQAIRNGDSAIVVAGGQESMTQAPHCVQLRAGVKMGGTELVDTLLRDGLWDAFHGYHMGNTAENVAQKWQIGREEQDRFALASQNKAEAAQKAGKFKDEIVPVTVKTRKGDVVVADDEYPKHGTTIETLAKLRAAFDKAGTVTAGNASGINDGAAVAVLMSEAEAARRGVTPLARIVSWGHGWRRSGDHGLWPDPGLAQGAAEGWLVGRGSRPDRGQRGLRGPGLRGQQGHGLGSGEGERQRWRHRDRPPGRRIGRARAQHAAVRDAAPRRAQGPRDAVHRRRHGHRALRRALNRKRQGTGRT